MIAQICIHKCILKISYRTRYTVCRDNRKDSASFLSLYEQGHYRVSIYSDSNTCALITAAYPCSRGILTFIKAVFLPC